MRTVQGPSYYYIVMGGNYNKFNLNAMCTLLGGGFLAMLKNGKFKFGKTYPNHCNYIHPGIIVK
jgi:hypothetical protein